MKPINPIPQYFADVKWTVCPVCLEPELVSVGTVTTPPTAVQVNDVLLGLDRDWQATRYRCTACGFLFDSVSKNEVRNVAEEKIIPFDSDFDLDGG